MAQDIEAPLKVYSRWHINFFSLADYQHEMLNISLLNEDRTSQNLSSTAVLIDTLEFIKMLLP